MRRRMSARAPPTIAPWPGTITIPAGQTRVTVPVQILNDTLSESTETFTFSIINVSSGTLLFPRTSNVSILDDENPVTEPPEPPLVSDYSVTQVNVVSTGLNQPIAFEFVPGSDELMITANKTGQIKLYNYQTGQDRGSVIDLSAEVNAIADRGILDIAIHPDVASNPYLYVFYTVDPPEAAGLTGNAGRDGAGNRYNQLARFTLDASTGYTTIVANSKTVILGAGGTSYASVSGGGTVDSTSNVTQAESGRTAGGGYVRDYLKMDSLSHAGGAIEFGPDGALYVSTGDGTSYNLVDPRTASVQDINSLSGKILRINPITGQGFSDNPFATGDLGANASKVYQLGLRNPFSMSFDETGKLLITDTGWNSWEEINSGGPGANFGWPWYEGGDNGTLARTTGYQDLAQATTFYNAVAAGTVSVTPAYRAFSHTSSAPGYQVQAITGSNDLIDSGRYPASLQGYYIFTDVSQGEVFAVSSDDRTRLEFLFRDTDNFAPVSFKQGPDGAIYYADLRSNVIGRLDILDIGNTITGTAGNDVLSGTAGIDIMRGLGGADTFLTSPGNDTIFGSPSAYSQIDYDGAAADYRITRNGDGSLTIVGSGTGTDRAFDIDGFWFRGEGRWYSVSDVLQPGGSTGPIRGTSGNDRLAGTSGNDVMIGNGGSDIFEGSLGNDDIRGNAGNYDQVDYGGARSTYTFARNANGTVTVTGALTGTDTLSEIDGFWFSGEGRWYGLAEVLATPGTITGTAGNDTLAGSPGNDVMIGNGGSDLFLTSLGNDDIRGNPGYDQVDYDGNAGNYTFTRNANGSVTVTGALTGTDTLSDIDGIWFRGSQQWSRLSDLISNGSTVTGTSGNDTLFGTRGNDIMIGNGGSDLFIGSLGNDDIRGNAPAYDQVNYDGRRTDYTFTRNANGTITVNGTGTGTDTLTSIEGFWFYGENAWYSAEQVTGAAARGLGLVDGPA